MPIRKGEPWGEAAGLPKDAPIASGDRELAVGVHDHRAHHGEAVPIFGLLGGDLCATLGGRGERAHLQRPEAHTLPCDLGLVRWDGGEDVFVAHVLARPWAGSGNWFAAMNAAWMGRRNVAPKAHPGDGRLEVLVSDLSLRDRVKAFRRLEHGAHVPHPSIMTRRVKAFVHESERPVRVFIDGEPRGRTRRLEVEVLPDAFCVVV